MAEIVTGTIQLRPVSRRLIRVTFSRNIVVEDALNATKYSVELFSSSGSPVNVLGVQGNDPDGNGKTSYVDVYLTNPSLGAVYKLTVADVRTSDNKILSSTEGYLRGRRTKVDSILEKLSRVYSTDLENSVLAHVCAGLGISDDIIGAGQNDFDVIAQITSSAGSTYETATYGTSTFGG